MRIKRQLLLLGLLVGPSSCKVQTTVGPGTFENALTAAVKKSFFNKDYNFSEDIDLNNACNVDSFPVGAALLDSNNSCTPISLIYSQSTDLVTASNNGKTLFSGQESTDGKSITIDGKSYTCLSRNSSDVVTEDGKGVVGGPILLLTTKKVSKLSAVDGKSIIKVVMMDSACEVGK